MRKGLEEEMKRIDEVEGCMIRVLAWNDTDNIEDALILHRGIAGDSHKITPSH